jgi:hypothetical protein
MSDNIKAESGLIKWVCRECADKDKELYKDAVLFKIRGRCESCNVSCPDGVLVPLTEIAHSLSKVEFTPAAAEGREPILERQNEQLRAELRAASERAEEWEKVANQERALAAIRVAAIQAELRTVVEALRPFALQSGVPMFVIASIVSAYDAKHPQGK